MNVRELDYQTIAKAALRNNAETAETQAAKALAEHNHERAISFLVKAHGYAVALKELETYDDQEGGK